MSLLVTVAIIVIWYGTNILLLLTNKYLLTNYGYRFPIFLTFLHMVSCALMSYAVVVSRIVQMQRIQSRQQLIKVATVALVFCASLVLANTSLGFIPVSFNQAIGSTTPAFTAVLAIGMLGKYEPAAVYWSLVPVVLGICIASGFEPSFHLFGFTCCILATAARAFKSVLQGILLADNSEKLDSLNLLLYMAPIASAALIPLTMIYEPTALTTTLSRAADDPVFAAALMFNVFLAYFVNLANFLVTKHTSALTLQVLGNAKGVIAAVISVMIFKNQLTGLGVMGYGITVVGVFCYSEVKRRSRSKASFKSGDAEEGVPLMLDAGKLKSKHNDGSPMSSPMSVALGTAAKVALS